MREKINAANFRTGKSAKLGNSTTSFTVRK